jgi:hypothetical protein
VRRLLGCDAQAWPGGAQEGSEEHDFEERAQEPEHAEEVDRSQNDHQS